MHKRHVSEVLTALMKSAGMGENELSRATGVPQPTIHRILSRASEDPKTGTLRPLANFFRVTVAQLRGDEPLPGSQKAVDLSTGPVLRHIPLLTWEEVATLGNGVKEHHGEKVVTTSTELGPRGFAAIVEGDAMLPAFPPGARIEVDPDAPVKSGCYVVALPEGGDAPLFRQYIEESGRRMLTPLNNRYQAEKCGKILGRVMAVTVAV